MSEYSVAHSGGPQTAGSTQNTANELAEMAKRFDYTSVPGVLVPAESQGNAFKAKYADITPVPFQEKKQLAQAVGADRIQTVVNVTDEDRRVLEHKGNLKQLMDFDKWVTAIYKPSADPSHSKFLQEVYPEYYEAREREMEDLHHLQLQWGKVCLRGPKSKEDLYLQYRVSMDPFLRYRLESDTAGPQAYENIENANQDMALGFIRGMFNPQSDVRTLQHHAIMSGIKNQGAAALGATSDPFDSISPSMYSFLGGLPKVSTEFKPTEGVSVPKFPEHYVIPTYVKEFNTPENYMITRGDKTKRSGLMEKLYTTIAEKKKASGS